VPVENFVNLQKSDADMSQFFFFLEFGQGIIRLGEENFIFKIST
jgi:hypothetical protein